MERKFNKGDIVQHFKREKMTEEQLKKNPICIYMKLLARQDTQRTTKN